MLDIGTILEILEAITPEPPDETIPSIINNLETIMLSDSAKQDAYDASLESIDALTTTHTVNGTLNFTTFNSAIETEITTKTDTLSKLSNVISDTNFDSENYRIYRSYHVWYKRGAIGSDFDHQYDQYKTSLFVNHIDPARGEQYIGDGSGYSNYDQYVADTNNKSHIFNLNESDFSSEYMQPALLVGDNFSKFHEKLYQSIFVSINYLSWYIRYLINSYTNTVAIEGLSQSTNTDIDRIDLDIDRIDSDIDRIDSDIDELKEFDTLIDEKLRRLTSPVDESAHEDMNGLRVLSTHYWMLQNIEDVEYLPNKLNLIGNRLDQKLNGITAIPSTGITIDMSTITDPVIVENQPLWAKIQNKPSTFPPATHEHAISNVSNLQSVLDNKAGLNHSHSIADVSNLQTKLDELKWTSKFIGETFYVFVHLVGIEIPPSTNYCICDGRTINDTNSPLNGQVIPNTIGKLLKHGATSGVSGGNNTKQLVEAELPYISKTVTSGTISADHTHSISIGATSTDHYHNMTHGHSMWKNSDILEWSESGGSHGVPVMNANRHLYGTTSTGYHVYDFTGNTGWQSSITSNYQHSHTASSGGASTNHTHSVTTSFGDSQAFSIENEYISAIQYIRYK